MRHTDAREADRMQEAVPLASSVRVLEDAAHGLNRIDYPCGPGSVVIHAGLCYHAIRASCERSVQQCMLVHLLFGTVVHAVQPSLPTAG